MSPLAAVARDVGERRILDAADELFARRGINAVTMADVRDGSGVSMRRLYATVGDKSELVDRWLADRDGRWLDEFDRLVDDRLAGGESAVDAVFDAVATLLVAGDFRGCAFINTLGELADLPEPTRAVIVAHKAAFADRLDRRLGRGGDLVVLVDGAIVHAVMHRNTDPVERARRIAHQLSHHQEHRT